MLPSSVHRRQAGHRHAAQDVGREQLADRLSLVAGETHAHILESALLRSQRGDHERFRRQDRLGIVVQQVDRLAGPLHAADRTQVRAGHFDHGQQRFQDRRNVADELRRRQRLQKFVEMRFQLLGQHPALLVRLLARFQSVDAIVFYAVRSVRHRATGGAGTLVLFVASAGGRRRAGGFFVQLRRAAHRGLAGAVVFGAAVAEETAEFRVRHVVVSVTYLNQFIPIPFDPLLLNQILQYSIQ